jgi:hypothetical protein
MDVTEQARHAVDEEFAAVGVTDVSDAREAASLVWLNGYKAGMDAMRKLADEAFVKLQARS